MKITIEGTAKEIADLVREIQDRQISGKNIADAVLEKMSCMNPYRRYIDGVLYERKPYSKEWVPVKSSDEAVQGK